MDSGLAAFAAPRNDVVPNFGQPARTKRAVARYQRASFAPRRFHPLHTKKATSMVITAAHITPLVALIAGILILIMPRLLNYIVALYLIFIGLVGLNNVHHFINWH